MNADYKHQ